MIPVKKKRQPVLAMLVNKDLPIAHRMNVLKSLANHENRQSNEILAEFIQIADSGNAATTTKQNEELNELIEELKRGPRRLGTFIRLQQSEGPVPRAAVKLENGETAFPILLEDGIFGKLQCGDNVMLDAHARVLVDHTDLKNETGEEAYFERRIGENQVEISMRGDERYVYTASKSLAESFDQGWVVPGNRILVSSRREIAFSPLPEEDGPAQYRYLDRSPVPDVVVERDIGAPSGFIAEITEMVFLEMTNPDLRRKYQLRRCMMKLLIGMPGTGKSYHILGLIRRVYEVVSEITETPLKELPPRVMRLNASSVLSKWLGESDKNIAQFFEEVAKLAEEAFTAPNGKEYMLPVIVVLEEIDGLAHARGEDPIMDRIFTTVLELLDPTRSALKDKFVIFLGTTNKAHLIDSGFLRRIGGTIEQFSSLDRNAFAAVLKKHLAGKPLAAENGDTQEEKVLHAAYTLTAWLFSPNGEDRGQAMLSFIGTGNPEIRYRRDFLTPGLVDRAVQHAAQLACEAEARGIAKPGLTSVGLKTAIDEQIKAIIKVLRANNVANYLELPEGTRVQSVQTMVQPPVLQAELMRAA